MFETAGSRSVGCLMVLCSSPLSTRSDTAPRTWYVFVWRRVAHHGHSAVCYGMAQHVPFGSFRIATARTSLARVAIQLHDLACLRTHSVHYCRELVPP